MNKILLVSLQKYGGGAIDALEFSNGLIENKFFHYILISEGNELREKFIENEFRKVLIIKTFSSNYFSFFLNTFLFFKWIKLIKILFKIKPKIVHITHFHIWSIFIFLFRPFLRYKIFYAVHDNPFEPKEEPALFVNFFEKIFCKKADIVLVYSNFMKESLKKYLDNKKIYVLPLGIHSDLCPNLIKEYNLDKDLLNVLFFGRLEEYKGLDILIKAFEILKKEGFKINLTIAGRGNIGDELKNQIKELEIDFKNYWIPNEELCELIKKADILVAPYKKGTQSGIISTALAYGIPVIATNVGSFSEYIKDGKNGFLIKPDPIELAERIKIFYKNRNLILEFSKESLKIGENFKWGKIAQKAIEIYNNE